ncbi:MAG: SO_0444 family Cu/Zn efflux transporter [Thiolinea sp.]
MMNFLQNLLALSLEAAPWLVLGFTLGGLMKALIPTAFLQRHLSGEGFGSISKAAVLGAPLPLCSCGVIPAALGLRKAGASKPATASFLVSTPETGIDSISITYALMGPLMAVVRPVAALVSALSAGLLVAFFDSEDKRKQAALQVQPEAAMAADSCCASEKPQEKAVSERSCCDSTPKTMPASDSGTASSSCCDSEGAVSAGAKVETSCCSSDSAVKTPAATESHWLQKGWGGVHYAFTRLLDDIAFWLVIGMLFAAATTTFLPPDFLAQWGQGIVAMIVMLLAGIPMYICATASTPVAAGLMMAGMSPGVALVFLLTGPATNISTLGVIGRELGQKSMWLYLTAVGVTAIVSGLLLDALVSAYQINIAAHLHAGHETFPVFLQWAALLLLLGLGLRKLPARFASTDLSPVN